MTLGAAWTMALFANVAAAVAGLSGVGLACSTPVEATVLGSRFTTQILLLYTLLSTLFASIL